MKYYKDKNELILPIGSYDVDIELGKDDDAIFLEYYKKLNFPDYFGFNWVPPMKLHEKARTIINTRGREEAEKLANMALINYSGPAGQFVYDSKVFGRILWGNHLSPHTLGFDFCC